MLFLQIHNQIFIKAGLFLVLGVAAGVADDAAVADGVIAGGVDVAVAPELDVWVIEDEFFEVAGKAWGAFVLFEFIRDGFAARGVVGDDHDFLVRELFGGGFYEV